MKRNIKKFLAKFLCAFVFFLMTATSAMAWNFSQTIAIGEVVDGGDIVNAMNDAFADLGLDKSELKYIINDMNVSRQKKQQPQVQVTFSPENPIPGQKVTATATPMNFMNEDKNLYFTWYIKEDGRGGDIDDWKIRAARMIANNDFEYQKESYDSDSDDDGYRAYFGGDDQQGKPHFCYIHDTRSGNEYRLGGTAPQDSCNSHIFAEAPGHDTGDNNFGKDEEKFWRTNPNDPDTADQGHTDEATIAGLGTNSFTWVYTEGDQIGVAVEGISIEATQRSNSSYKIMWALPKNKCDELSEYSTGGSVEAADSLYTDMKVSDINKCLEQNLIDPAEGGGIKEKLNIELSYSPEFPMNDPTSGSSDGDKITVNSSVINAQNDGYLNYSWQVYKSDEANPESWGTPLTKAKLIDSTQTSGMGADSLSFKLNISDSDPFYLKIKLTVRENISKKLIREGHADVVIPISSATEKIKAYKTNISNNSSGDPIISMSSTELCDSGTNKSICPVVKDQIVGIKVPSGSLSDYAWTINGEPFSYSTCFFEGCDLEKETNVAFFPILDDPGTQYEITLAATDITSGKKVNLTRIFEVVEPSIKISSADESTCKPVLLGHYIDYDGKEWPDWSERNFEALTQEKIKLTADFIGFVPEGANYGWIVDGIGINKDTASVYGYEINSNNELVITAKELGETTNVGISALYFPDTLTKKALNTYWDVSYGNFYETEVGDSIDIASVDSLAGESVAKNKITDKNKIMASLFSSTPTYLAFLLRIVLTGSLLLFFSAFILSFFPNIKEEQI